MNQFKELQHVERDYRRWDWNSLWWVDAIQTGTVLKVHWLMVTVNWRSSSFSGRSHWNEERNFKWNVRAQT